MTDNEVRRLARAAKLPAYMWDTTESVAALGRFLETAAPQVAHSKSEYKRLVAQGAGTKVIRAAEGKGPSPTVVMPRTATEAMIEAAHNTPSRADGIQYHADVYAAMVKAGEVPPMPPPNNSERGT